MSTFFGNEQMEAARVLAEEIRNEIDPSLSVTENMVRSLRMRTVDLDAEAVVRDLCAGIRNFHEAYEDANEMGLDAMIIQNVDKILGEMNEEQQRELLTGILQTCANATGSEVPEDMDLETMKQTACYCISEYSLIFAGSEAFQKMAELDEETVAAITEASVSAQEAGYVALALYLLNAAGKMEAEGMNAEQIGAMTAATLAAHRAVEEAAEAEVENETEEQTEARYEKLKKILKIIGGALTIAVIIGAVALSVIMPGIFLAEGVMILLCWPSFGVCLRCVAAIIIGLSGVAHSIGYGVQSVVRVAKRSGIADGIVTAYRKSAEFVTETLVPTAKLFWEVLRETVRQKAALFRAAKETADINEAPVVETVNNAVAVEKTEEIEEVKEEEEEEKLDA